ncbi:MAG: hypothetical protein Kow0074_04660 [Candidatus Zixiibacteriota bacterium]
MHRGLPSIVVLLTSLTISSTPAFCQSLKPGQSPSPVRVGLASKRNTPILRTLAIGAVLTLAARSNDHRVQEEAVDAPILEMGGVDLGDAYGNGFHLVAASIGTWGIGHLTDDVYTKETAGLLIKSLLLEGAIVYGAKNVFRRSRPDNADHLSFPSGHTAGAFTFSTVLARRHGWAIGAVAYSLATLTAAARLEDNRHFLSDVVAGATVGIAVGQFMTRGKTRADRKAYLYADANGLGIGLSF